MNAFQPWRRAILVPALGLTILVGGCTSAAPARLSDNDKALLAPGLGNMTPDQLALQSREEAKGKAAEAAMAKSPSRPS